MPLTRVLFDQMLALRVGPLFVKVALDGTTVDGTNPAFSLCIAAGLASLGTPAAIMTSVTDADLAAVTGTGIKQLTDVAVLDGLEMVLSRWTKPNATAGTDNKQDQGGLRNSIEITVARMKRDLEKEFGVGLGTVTAGTFNLNFTEPEPEE